MLWVTYGNGGGDVLDEEHTLELEDKEVDELVDLGEETLEVLSGDCVVASRAEAGDEALRTKRLSGDFERGSGYGTCTLAIHPAVRIDRTLIVSGFLETYLRRDTRRP